ncbi:MAG TPA: hypothetical protein VGQ94_05325 [Terriglobales bacterium]|nr:hypothetical protein [Terriglobales bacterium]
MSDRQPSGTAELLAALLLTAAPLAGVGWILWRTSVFTVDSLFTILILLTISGIFSLDLLLEFYHRFLKGAGAASKAPVRVGAAPAAAAGETRTESGVIRNIQYFEAAVGVPNKSLVTFTPDGAATSYLLSLCGNVQSQLQTGRRVQLTYRAATECDTLLSWNYL